MGETPFNLVYGTKAMIPIEELIHTERVSMVSNDENEDFHRLDLAVAEEKRDLATIRLAHSKQLAKYYNKRVRPLSFKPEDHIIRKNKDSKAVG
ncbi:hypothetical protein Tco_1376168 [Tanacetum coccineum]